MAAAYESDALAGNLHALEEHGIENFSLAADSDCQLASFYPDVSVNLICHLAAECPFVLGSYSTHQ